MEKCCNIHDAINKFYDGILAYVKLKIRNQSDVQDIVQDIMLKMFNAYNSDKKIVNLKNWIYTITNNTIIEYYRRNNNKSDFNIIDDEESELYTISEYIIPMINLLDEKYSQILLLSDIENIPQKEIADRLNLGISAAKSRIQRARKQLRELFTECCDMEFDKNGVIVSCHIKKSCKPLNDLNIQEKI
jgi:RNA polymerase sigma-70 factor (ECF subfamily)